MSSNTSSHYVTLCPLLMGFASVVLFWIFYYPIVGYVEVWKYLWHYNTAFGTLLWVLHTFLLPAYFVLAITAMNEWIIDRNSA
jgi:low affinity Fe/Cu permease